MDMAELMRAYNTVNERKKHIVINQLKEIGITHVDGVSLKEKPYNELVYMLAMERSKGQ
jgi:hypothetical protein